MTYAVDVKNYFKIFLTSVITSGIKISLLLLPLHYTLDNHLVNKFIWYIHIMEYCVGTKKSKAEQMYQLQNMTDICC